MSAIGSAINSLPLAYAPLNSTGRYVAYAIALPAVSVGFSSAANFIAAPTLSIDAGGDVAPVGYRSAPAVTSVSIGGAVFVRGDILADGATLAALLATFTPTSVKLKDSAVMAAATTAGLSSITCRARPGLCNFTSLYVPVGERSSGNAVGSFALNVGALNARSGQHRQVFDARFAPSGVIIADGEALLEADGGDGLSAGSVVCDGQASYVAGSESIVIPNALFALTAAPDATTAFAPVSGAARDGSASASAASAWTVVGNYIAGGLFRFLRSFGTSVNSFALNSHPINSLPFPHLKAIESTFIPSGNYVAGPSPSLNALSGLSPIGNAIWDPGSRVEIEEMGFVSYGNSFWGGNVALTCEASAPVLGSVFADGQTAMEQPSAGLAPHGNILADGLVPMVNTLLSTAAPSVIFDPSILFQSDSNSTLLGSYIAAGQTAIIYPSAIKQVVGSVFFDGEAALGTPYGIIEVAGTKCLVASALLGTPYWDYMSATATLVSSVWIPFYGPVCTIYAAFDDTKGIACNEDVVLSIGPYRQINPQIATLGAFAFNVVPLNTLDPIRESSIEEMAISETTIHQTIPTSIVWGGEDI
jgi:hypothetical protein